MITVKNDLIPFPGFAAITIWPFVFVRKDCAMKMTDKQYQVMVNHESIHCSQQKELLLIPFYIMYLLEWLIKCIYYGNSHTAYRNISFEKEAYANESNMEYLDGREHYAEFRKEN